MIFRCIVIIRCIVIFTCIVIIRCVVISRCVVFFMCVWFIYSYVLLNQHQMLGWKAYLDMRANIRKLGEWRILHIWWTWWFRNQNINLASINLWWTADMSTKLCPGMPRIASSSTECYFLLYVPIIPLNFILYLLLSTCFYIREIYFSHWKPPGVFQRIWSVNLDASISGEYQTLGGLPGAPKVLSGASRCSQTCHNHSHGTPVAVIRDPSYSECQQQSTWECRQQN